MLCYLWISPIKFTVIELDFANL